MKRATRIPFSNLKFDQWQNLILIAILFYYLFQFGFAIGKNGFLVWYGADHLAFYSAGKIADETGFANIYDLEKLESIQAEELNKRGLLEIIGGSKFDPTPVPVLSFFIIPFQLLSRVELELSYWIWTAANLALLAGYLLFFLNKVRPKLPAAGSDRKLVFIMLLSFPAIETLIWGQVEVFLLICTGEFIRSALNRKPFLSGLWLGGLLLKPQILILIVPVLLILRYWKPLMGFAVSSSIIFFSSLALSGINGMKGMIDLWTGYAGGMATNWPDRMINWRMVGVNLNALLNTQLGWVLTGLGVVLTMLAVHFLVKNRPVYGSTQWVMVMLGVFSATLALTWHSHYHMALALTPFLIYGAVYKLLSEKILFLWVSAVPIATLGLMIVSLLVLLLTGINISVYRGILAGLIGFSLSLAILKSVYQACNKSFEEQPTANYSS